MNQHVVHSADIYRNHQQPLTRILPNLLHAVIAVLAGTKHTSSVATESKNADQFKKILHCGIYCYVCNESSLKIPPLLKHVATLPCEISNTFVANVTFLCLPAVPIVSLIYII